MTGQVASTESVQSNKVVQAYSKHVNYEIATQFNISDKTEALLNLMAGSLSVRYFMKLFFVWVGHCQGQGNVRGNSVDSGSAEVGVLELCQEHTGHYNLLFQYVST